jgi:membrane associated rhomboid family serine protease
VIPLRDTIQTRRFAYFNYLLILVNTVFFVFEIKLGRKIEPFIMRYGLVPAVWTDPMLVHHMAVFDKWSQLATSMFLHGSWLHVISNLWCLSIFGKTVEDKVGHLQYLFLYLVSGLASGGLQLATHWGSPIPTVGASGAIAGVMGAYFVLFPRARIVTLIPILIFPWLVEIPAVVFLGFWFLSQLVSGLLTIGTDLGQIAWWSHIGGFAAGIFLARKLPQ